MLQNPMEPWLQNQAEEVSECLCNTIDEAHEDVVTERPLYILARSAGPTRLVLGSWFVLALQVPGVGCK